MYHCMQVLERDQIMNRFQEVTAELEQALSGISFENLDISDEVKEQVDTVLQIIMYSVLLIPVPNSEMI